MNAIRVLGCVVTVLSLAVGCANEEPYVAPPDAALPQLTGVYACAIEVVDDYVSCGGPVYRSDLSGQDVSMSITQVGTMLEVGMWSRILTGTVDLQGHVSLVHKDTTCAYCGPGAPLVIEVEATAGQRQLSGMNITLVQFGVGGDCSKTYRGTCATN